MKPPVPGASKPANERGNLDDHAPDTLGSQVNISVFLGILIDCFYHAVAWVRCEP